MKRNSLTTAVVAGIAGVAGFASLAGAVDLNPDGLGQVLIYPYYTVNAHQQTLLSVVNTTSVSKAVKVRFLEGYNSEEVLDFHVFLSPFDVWTATVFARGDAGLSGDGAAVFTTDHTCTKPYLFAGEQADGSITTGGGTSYYKSFVNSVYVQNDPSDSEFGLVRTREGHVELITMADIVGGSPTDTKVTHVNGTPPGCGSLDPSNPGPIIADLTAPTGGIFGAGAVVNVAQGTYYSYNADAIDGFTATVIYDSPGLTTPALTDVNTAPLTATAFVFDAGNVVTATYPGAPGSRPLDAVSAVYTSDALYNEYIADSNVGAGTDWVVTFPTKRFYVSGVPAAIPPFEELFGENTTNNSCTIIGVNIYDREEGSPVSTCSGGFGGNCFSPPPIGQPANAICKETNVISFLGASAPGAGTTSGVLGSALVLNIPPFAAAGWMRLDLNVTGGGHDMLASAEGVVFHGLPATGFAATNLVNNNLTDAHILSNYSGLFRHRASRSCTGGTSPACS